MINNDRTLIRATDRIRILEGVNDRLCNIGMREDARIAHGIGLTSVEE